ncbi:MAG: SirA family protein [Clostridia bacterium]|nr:SirA family protein [Clostridia bacterium]
MDIDVRGLSCPIPVVRTKAAVEKGATSLVITGDTQVSKENVSRYLRSVGYKVVEEVSKDGTWTIKSEKQGAAS